jgi:AcrR family transcriptional regulator
MLVAMAKQRTAAKTKGMRGKPRRRLDAEVARGLILDAAEKRLVTVGPAGIRLQEVASDAGVSHPTVLHHFGSRELLLKALITRSAQRINAEVIEALARTGSDDMQLEALLENVAHNLESSGSARVMLWLALAGHNVDATAGFGALVDAAHALRLARWSGSSKRPTREDTARVMVLVTIAIVGGSVLAPSLLGDAGLPLEPATHVQWKRWFARFVLGHIDR